MELSNQPSDVVLAGIDNRFKYHSPNKLQAELHEKIRDQHKELALHIIQNTTDCRETALAITKLEESMMWANAAIARNKPFYNSQKEE